MEGNAGACSFCASLILLAGLALLVVWPRKIGLGKIERDIQEPRE